MLLPRDQSHASQAGRHCLPARLSPPHPPPHPSTHTPPCSWQPGCVAYLFSCAHTAQGKCAPCLPPACKGKDHTTHSEKQADIAFCCWQMRSSEAFQAGGGRCHKPAARPAHSAASAMTANGSLHLPGGALCHVPSTPHLKYPEFTVWSSSNQSLHSVGSTARGGQERRITRRHGTRRGVAACQQAATKDDMLAGSGAWTGGVDQECWAKQVPQHTPPGTLGFARSRPHHAVEQQNLGQVFLIQIGKASDQPLLKHWSARCSPLQCKHDNIGHRFPKKKTVT